VKLAESPAPGQDGAEIPSVAEHQSSRAPLERSRPPKPGSPKKGRPGELAGIYIGGGRKLKIRPGDIVGAIVNEAKLSAESIGAIQIAERHSTVQVPKDIVDHVIAALNATSIKGKKLVVRRDRA
jgi:ATP-dependent RNA helicase DeaD